MKSTKNLTPKVLKKSMEGSDKPKEQPNDLEDLAAAFEGFEVSKYVDQHGIDPSKILRYRETKSGETIFLCMKEIDDKEVFYILRASPKTEDWKKIVSEYQKE